MASKLGVAALTSSRLFTASTQKPLISRSKAVPISSSLRNESVQFTSGRRLVVRRKLLLIALKATTEG